LIGILVIEIPFLLAVAGWFRLFQTNVEHLQLIQKQDLFQILLPRTKQMKGTNQTSAQQFRTKFEGLDVQDLLAKIEGATAQNLRIRITHD
jgi:hypothetical protein